jgi:enediyne biosynthesis protein E4
MSAGPPSSAGEGVTITLAVRGSTSVPQGGPFLVQARVENPGSDPVTVSVALLVDGQRDDEEAMEFLRWGLSLPGGGAERIRASVVPSQWFEETGGYLLSATVDDLASGNVVPLEVLPATVVVPRFQDVTASAGLEATLPPRVPCKWTSGAAWGDIEGDGDLDLYLPAREGPARLWVNDGAGRFADEAVARGTDNAGAEGASAVFADYDNDGDQDLYVVNFGPNRLYRNDGAGRFADVAPAAGVDDPREGASASWGDYDGDGWLDLYVTNNLECRSGPTAYEPDRLYHNEGDGTFTDQTASIGVDATLGSGFQSVWFDYDGDGDQDLYLANDYIGADPDRNHLWRNDGPGEGEGWAFTDVSAESGTDWAMNSMGIAVGDYDRDLDLDFALSDIAGNALALNRGDGTFIDSAGPAGVERVYQRADRTSVTWGLGFHDLNLDGWEDLLVIAGALLEGDPYQPDQLLVNAANGTFLDLSAPGGMTDPAIGRGAAFADFDRDGRMDVYVVNQEGTPRLLRNVTTQQGLHWLEVDTVGRASNRDGCGATLTAEAGGAIMLRQVLCGSSLGAGSDTVVHLGLGTVTRVTRLVIRWPSGTRQVLRNVAVDRLLTVTEP